MPFIALFVLETILLPRRERARVYTQRAQRRVLKKEKINKYKLLQKHIKLRSLVHQRTTPTRGLQKKRERRRGNLPPLLNMALINFLKESKRSTLAAYVPALIETVSRVHTHCDLMNELLQFYGVLKLFMTRRRRPISANKIKCQNRHGGHQVCFMRNVYSLCLHVFY